MNRIVIAAVILGLSVVAGCGGGAEGGKPVFPVTGNVTMFGGALVDATIAFAPTVPGQPTAMGKTDKEGNFTLTTYEYGDGAAEGQYKVVISKLITTADPNASAGGGGEGEHEAQADSGDSHAAAKKNAKGNQNMVPSDYTSSSTTKLTAEVKADGERVFSFNVE